MSFVSKQPEKFSTVFNESPYFANEPIVKVQYIPRGNNVVFGRSIQEGSYDDLIYIGKIYESTAGRNMLSFDGWLDVTFPHVIYVTGARGSGKSFDLGVLIEGISELKAPSPVQNNVKPICSIIIDTQSQFWTLKYMPNDKVPQNVRQIEELAKWNIKPNVLSKCVLFIPPGADAVTGTEQVFTIKTSDVRHEEWCALIGEGVYSPQGHVLGQAMERLNGIEYSLEELIACVRSSNNLNNIPETSRNAILYKLEGYRRTGLFSSRGIEVRELIKNNQCSVFMLRDLRNEDKALVTAVIARQLADIMGKHHKRLKLSHFFGDVEVDNELPSKAWLIIDEAHIVAPSNSPSPATDALVDYVKRGRDAGLSLALATQQPSAVNDGILSQVNITFSHRLTFQTDITAAMNRIPTKLLRELRYSGRDLRDFGDMLRYLEAGECFVGDHNTSRTVLATIRPRVTSHGGYSPN